MWGIDATRADSRSCSCASRFVGRRSAPVFAPAFRSAGNSCSGTRQGRSDAHNFHHLAGGHALCVCRQLWRTRWRTGEDQRVLVVDEHDGRDVLKAKLEMAITLTRPMMARPACSWRRRAHRRPPSAIWMFPLSMAGRSPRRCATSSIKSIVLSRASEYLRFDATPSVKQNHSTVHVKVPAPEVSIYDSLIEPAPASPIPGVASGV